MTSLLIDYSKNVLPVVGLSTLVGAAAGGAAGFSAALPASVLAGFIHCSAGAMGAIANGNGDSAQLEEDMRQSMSRTFTQIFVGGIAIGAATGLASSFVVATTHFLFKRATASQSE